MKHRQCAWCLRLKHNGLNGKPHGPAWPGLLKGYSHGICTECEAKLLTPKPQEAPKALPELAVAAR